MNEKPLCRCTGNQNSAMKSLMLRYWWLPVVLLAITEALNVGLLMTRCVFLANLLLVLFAGAFLTVSVSWVYLLKNKKWRQFAISFLISVIITLASMSVSLFLIMFYPQNDEFGKKHPIPEGMDYSIPHDTGTQADSLDRDSYLQIHNDYQGGIYMYDFYYGALPAGEVYLKCYEATENIPLSTDRIREESKVTIESTYSFTQVVNRQRFIIYEGDWGDYYAARIEVWHKDAHTGKETKLCEKTYRVEGWMR